VLGLGARDRDGVVLLAVVSRAEADRDDRNDNPDDKDATPMLVTPFGEPV
jgi:hypothetical protein